MRLKPMYSFVHFTELVYYILSSQCFARFKRLCWTLAQISTGPQRADEMYALLVRLNKDLN